MKPLHVLIGFYCFATIGLTSIAYASNPADMAAAEALFQEAQKLMEQDKYKDACPKLVESQRLDPAVGTLLYLGECYERNGQTASAWATFELAAAEGRNGNEAKRAIVAKERAQQLVSKLSRLLIVVPESAKMPELAITSNGRSIGAASWGSSLPVDPGSYVIVVSAPGKESWTVELHVDADTPVTQVNVPKLESVKPKPIVSKAGELDDANNVSAVRPKTVDRKTPITPKSPSKSDKYWTSQRIWGGGIAGGGMVGLSVGVILVLIGQSKEKESEKYCNPANLSVCSQKGNDLLDEANARNRLGNVFLGVGGAIVVGGAVVFFSAPSTPKNHKTATNSRWMTLSPVLSAHGGMLAVSSRF